MKRRSIKLGERISSFWLALPIRIVPPSTIPQSLWKNRGSAQIKQAVEGRMFEMFIYSVRKGLVR